MPKKTKKAKALTWSKREKRILSPPIQRHEHSQEVSKPTHMHYSLSLPHQTHHSHPVMNNQVDQKMFEATKRDITITVILASLALSTLFILSRVLG